MNLIFDPKKSLFTSLQTQTIGGEFQFVFPHIHHSNSFQWKRQAQALSYLINLGKQFTLSFAINCNSFRIFALKHHDSQFIHS